MLTFLSLCLPIFAVIGVGFVAAKARWLPGAAVDAIGLFSFNFALPAMLVRLMAAQPLSESFEGHFFRAYLAACLVTFAATLGICLLRGQGRRMGAALGAASAMGNVGYLAPPLMLPMLGPRIAGPVAMAIVAEVAVIIAIGTVLMSPAIPGERLRLVLRSLKGLTRNPVILSIAAGALLAALDIGVPPSIGRFLEFLGNAAGPTALFALGGTIGRLHVGRRLLALASAVTLAKLVTYPALVWLLLGPVLGMENFWVASGVLLAAMPTATNAFILAQRNGAGAAEVSAIVLISTILAAIAFPATAWLVIAAG